jgi:hypothetical protein
LERLKGKPAVSASTDAAFFAREDICQHIKEGARGVSSQVWIEGNTQHMPAFSSLNHSTCIEINAFYCERFALDNMHHTHAQTGRAEAAPRSQTQMKWEADAFTESCQKNKKTTTQHGCGCEIQAKHEQYARNQVSRS